MNQECRNCKYFVKQDDFGGECYLNPPVVHVQHFEGETEGWDEGINYRPRVSLNEFCSYFVNSVKG